MLEVMRDILQSRYLRSNVAHKQLARTSLSDEFKVKYSFRRFENQHKERELTAEMFTKQLGKYFAVARGVFFCSAYHDHL